MTKKERAALDGLQYIAASPPYEHGGFHPNAVQAAKDGIEVIRLALQRKRRKPKPKAKRRRS